MGVLCAVVSQVLLTIPLDGEPARFGVPLSAAAVARGLRATGGAVLQWRRLPIGDAAADPVWVELALVGRGTVRLCAGGAAPAATGHGAAFVRDDEVQRLPAGDLTRTTWRWCSGAVDEQARLEFAVPTEVDGEAFLAGEALTRVTVAPAVRAAALCRLSGPRFVAAGVLPPAGRLAVAVRRELLATLPGRHELPGLRGAGDFARSGGVVTNLEFDTTLAVLRCALATGDPAMLALAGRCARHLCDRDLDRRSGLPFAHGSDHRTGAPEPGHAWLQGLLWAGCWLADDGMLATARSIGRALAARPPSGEGRGERARDFAWPLLELEALLAFDPDPALAAAADRLALAIASRHDRAAHTFRFGEGEVGEGLYLERAWITGGVVLPALRAHLRRRPDAALAEAVRDAEQALLTRILATSDGVPTHWRVAGGEVFGVHAARGDPRALMLLEGLPPGELARLLRRSSLQNHLEHALRPDDPDLPTAWTMVARNEWVWR
ncbi:MAG: hypothetical protein JNM25_09805 [Planctomycetes bacterium]|nr:hypothetical protein [Planctomycetota bacterium]